MCRAYCHKVIKLSAALQRFAPGKEEVRGGHNNIQYRETTDPLVCLMFTQCPSYQDFVLQTQTDPPNATQRCEQVANVHGVRREFLEVGDQAKGTEMEGAYFIGKVRFEEWEGGREHEGGVGGWDRRRGGGAGLIELIDSPCGLLPCLL